METVWLQRPHTDIPWGFRLQGGRDYQAPLQISRVNADSIAALRLHPGDIVTRISQHDADYLTHSQATELVKSCGNTLQISISKNRSSHAVQPTHIAQSSDGVHDLFQNMYQNSNQLDSPNQSVGGGQPSYSYNPPQTYQQAEPASPYQQNYSPKYPTATPAPVSQVSQETVSPLQRQKSHDAEYYLQQSNVNPKSDFDPGYSNRDSGYSTASFKSNDSNYGYNSPYQTTPQQNSPNYQSLQQQNSPQYQPVQQPTTPQYQPTQPTTQQYQPTQPTTPQYQPTQPTTPQYQPTQPTTPQYQQIQSNIPQYRPIQPTTPQYQPTQPTTPQYQTTQPTTPQYQQTQQQNTPQYQTSHQITPQYQPSHQQTSPQYQPTHQHNSPSSQQQNYPPGGSGVSDFTVAPVADFTSPTEGIRQISISDNSSNYNQSAMSCDNTPRYEETHMTANPQTPQTPVQQPWVASYNTEPSYVDNTFKLKTETPTTPKYESSTPFSGYERQPSLQEQAQNPATPQYRQVKPTFIGRAQPQSEMSSQYQPTSGYQSQPTPYTQQAVPTPYSPQVSYEPAAPQDQGGAESSTPESSTAPPPPAPPPPPIGYQAPPAPPAPPAPEGPPPPPAPPPPPIGGMGRPALGAGSSEGGPSGPTRLQQQIDAAKSGKNPYSYINQINDPQPRQQMSDPHSPSQQQDGQQLPSALVNMANKGGPGSKKPFSYIPDAATLKQHRDKVRKSNQQRRKQEKEYLADSETYKAVHTMDPPKPKPQPEEGGVEGGDAADDEAVRYKGGHIPSKSFQMLQEMTKDEPDPAPSSEGTSAPSGEGKSSVKIVKLRSGGADKAKEKEDDGATAF